MNWHKRLAAYALLVLLGGCCPALPPPANQGRSPVPFAVLLSPGVTIRAADGSWQIVGGAEPVEAPFVHGHPAYSLGPADKATSLDQNLGLYENFLGSGAQRVLVDVEGRETPLNGVLALLEARDSAVESSAKRAYRIQVPPQRIEQAIGGRVSVVYQPYTYQGQTIVQSSGSCPRYVDASGEAVTWVLWISDLPL